MMSSQSKEQLEMNYKAFRELLPGILSEKRGKFALMRDGKVTDFFDTARDAYFTGQKLFRDQTFSVQEVTDTSVDLGFFSHAVPERLI